MTQHEWISLLDAVELIAEHVYKNIRDQKAAKRNARRCIEYATDKKLLDRVPVGQSWKFNRHDFLQWAVAKWPDLRDALSIPHVIESSTAPLGITGYEPSANIDSSDPAELLSELNKCRNTIAKQRAEIDRLRVIESYWNDHVEQDQIRRKNQGKHGKKGRGIKKNY